MNNYQKYLKYKNKYINLKNILKQEGGASNSKFDLNRAHVVEVQNKFNGNETNISTNDNSILLGVNKSFVNKVNDANSILDNYLNKLMIKDEKDEINLEFLNLLSALPFYSNKFEIKKDKYNNFSFTNTNINYKISKIILAPKSEIGGGGGEYIFELELKEEIQNPEGHPKNLVLKLFNIDYESYTDYTPMIFHEIFDNENNNIPGFDNRYYPIKKKDFNNICLDKRYDQSFIGDEGNDIFISCGLDNFKNEFVQNIILRNILKDTDFTENLIKFYNIMYLDLKTDGMLMSDSKRYGAILMEKIDYTLYDVLNKDSCKINKDELPKELEKLLKSLALVKNNVNCFNHSDLKTQNIFIRKETEGNIGKLLIADLDKSSITYNKIRFFNNAWVSKNFDPVKLARIFTDLTVTDKTIKINELNSRVYFDVEFETLIYRYNFFPFPPFFDLIVLYCELILLTSSCEGDNFEKSNISKIFNNYLSNTNIKNLTETISDTKTLDNIDFSNFGEIVKYTIIVNNVEIPLNVKNIENDKKIDNKVVTQVKLYKNNISGKKLIITPEIYINTSLRKPKSMFLTSYEYKCRKVDDESNKYTYNIFYTGNNYLEKGTIIFKTNRYTQLNSTYEFLNKL
jgi:hypothetical protein